MTNLVALHLWSIYSGELWHRTCIISVLEIWGKFHQYFVNYMYQMKCDYVCIIEP